MLSKSLYNLCLLISTPYENLNLFSNEICDLDYPILEEIYLKKLFNFKWRKKLNSSFKNFQFDYIYEILDQNSNFIKLKINLKIYFIVENSPNNICSTSIQEYIVILEYLHNKFKFQYLIENEENPLLYNYALKTDLSHIDNLIFSKKQSLSTNKLSSIDLFYEVFMTSSFFSANNSSQRKESNFNISEACNYAETFALNPNPNYKSFEDIGGDCTNFISQILYAGGVKQTKAWSPYTNSWIRVEDIYLYLTTNKLATKLPNETSLSKGCLIQFYTPQIGRFFHNGFITYELPNNDYLYCCHSYNKLNYPLSEIFPNRYPTLRALKIN
ncbi:hypothetical protein DIC82_10280 [Clostridium beijerinckii]|nr:hypothetical protein DIC82_10280 [Clostridium beijerinckii]